MADIQQLKKDYPWIQTPLVIGAPMRLISLAELAVEVTKAGTRSLPNVVSNCTAVEPEHAYLSRIPISNPNRPSAPSTPSQAHHAIKLTSQQEV